MFAEHPIFQQILRRVIFGNRMESRGIVFSRFFDPVSLETIALFMTLIRYTISLFSTGIYVQPDKRDGFTEQEHKKYYVEYLQALQEWNSCHEVVVLNIRKRMYKRAREKSGIDVSDSAALVTEATKVQMKLQLADRTGDTDTEEEEDDYSDNDTTRQPSTGNGSLVSTSGERGAA
ncbi:hypothetical protein K435DRAFT_966778 [Dendrothele bispora CBS 962.96]|uniref:DUF6532 domain-containing protein n=1 Tax=Dendrothele bispora (strain CBS 962.96) TaxID=1314807 RepID=A0A4S8LYB6_DENBC|nr:hypothetical protein K435DRAFT_966778 [Dendrothele bispora CBS 962.96]